ncbi:hypothetical protein GCM10009554_61950 [Kribbella koreensis]|uniref:Tetratricopeptide repeat protein n=1 Tax=Kribbella koreensis TaxID=57909 RepID=A0ABN1RCY2_9ACTN
MTFHEEVAVSNAFVAMMSSFDDDDGRPLDLYSGGVSEAFGLREETFPSFPISQVFEPAVRREAAIAAGLDDHDLATLRTGRTVREAGLRQQLEQMPESGGPERLYFTSMMVALSRFEIASTLIDESLDRSLPAPLAFEFALLGYIVGNRVGAKKDADWFALLRGHLSGGEIAPARALDACAQAIVCQMKTGALDRDDYRWFVEYGTRCAIEHKAEVDQGGLSSWYRGVAMIPAKGKDVGRTRELMERARGHAVAALSTNRSRYYDRHLLKTYLESTAKECLYVNRDRDKAVEAAQALVDLDPVWGPSWGEFGEIYESFGEYRNASEAYLQACRCGPPWLQHYAWRLVRVLERLDEPERCLEILSWLADFDPAGTPTEVLERGAGIAKNLGRPTEARAFRAALTNEQDN